MSEVEPISDPEKLRSIQAKVELLLRDRRSLLEQIESSYASQANALTELDLAQNRLLNASADYERFLDRNLLWIPSATPFALEPLNQLAPAVAWLLDPARWGAALLSLGQALRHSSIGATGALLALVMALYFRRSLAGAVVVNPAVESKEVAIDGPAPEISEEPGAPEMSGPSEVRIIDIFAALALAALRALPLPFLMAVMAWAMHRSPELGDFAAAFAAALGAAAPFLYHSLLLRTLAARDGVMRAHFSWTRQRLQVLRRQANRLTAVGVPLAFATALAYSSAVSAHRESLGRLCFLLLMALVAAVLFQLLHPSRGISAQNPLARPRLLHRAVHLLATSAPVLLALISTVGYTYTALTLAGQLIDTYWLTLGLYFGRLIGRRWLELAGRGMLEERAAEDINEAQPPATRLLADPPAITFSQAPDPDTVDQQSKRLLDAGLAFVALLGGWAIWAQVIPALGVLDRTALWSGQVLMNGVETVVPVTLADLLLALLVLAVAFIAAKNLPGLMEIALLQRLTLQPGSRHAINTLLRYVILLVGAVTAFNIIGWRWSQIQWLAAAISVGLGFGLQEIVANFVSGLVILFERPVRVGDTVTVGQVTGTVSRFRIRATTLTDWDRKEIIVPNKSFITEQVINWTLSDPITRIVVPVGIAYGSDVERAREIMEQTLRRLPLVLDEPPPKVFFVGFGDSSLDFKLHVFARQLSDRLPLTDAVHEKILGALREQDIEIPFPQRDLHMKTSD